MLPAVVAALLQAGNSGFVFGDPNPAGTYEVRICRDSCEFDTPEVAISGWLVLFDSAIDLSCLPRELEDDFKYRSMYLLGADGNGNACFVLTTRTEDVMTFAGITRLAITSWGFAGNTISVQLYASPDAFTHAIGQVYGDFLWMNLHDSGYIGRSFNRRSDRLFAVRLGAPDLDVCVRAAGDHWVGRTRESEIESISDLSEYRTKHCDQSVVADP